VLLQGGKPKQADTREGMTVCDTHHKVWNKLEKAIDHFKGLESHFRPT
jgi:hypothetical protein